MIDVVIRTDVTGLTAIEKLTLQRTITLKGVKAGVKILLQAAKSGAPRASGALAQAQGTKAAKGRQGLTVSFAVQGARKKTVKMVRRAGRRKPQKAVPALYDHLVRLGAKPHAVGKGSAVGGGKRKSGAQTGGMHPGMKGRDFRRQAWESTKDAAAAATLIVMGAEVHAAIAAQSAAILSNLGGR